MPVEEIGAGLEFTERPALAPFITVQQLTDYIGRDVTADNGAAFAVTAACDVVRTTAEQWFNRGTTTYLFDGTGTDAILMPDLPVHTVPVVTVNGGTITDYELKSNGILLRGTAGEDPRPTWPRGRGNVGVMADHGYEVIDVPADVKMVALSLAARIVIQGVATEEQLGSSRIKYGGPAMDLTRGETAILGKYRTGR